MFHSYNCLTRFYSLIGFLKLVCFLDYLREACQLVDKAQTKTTIGEQPSGSTSCTTDSNVGDNNAVKKGKQNLEKKKKGKKIFTDKSKESKKGKLLTGSSPLVHGVFPCDNVNSTVFIIFRLYFYEFICPYLFLSFA